MYKKFFDSRFFLIVKTIPRSVVVNVQHCFAGDQGSVTEEGRDDGQCLFKAWLHQAIGVKNWHQIYVGGQGKQCPRDGNKLPHHHEMMVCFANELTLSGK